MEVLVADEVIAHPMISRLACHRFYCFYNLILAAVSLTDVSVKYGARAVR